MESSSDDMLELLNKKNSISANEKAAAFLNKIGIPFRPHFLVNPAFDIADFEKLGNYVRKLNLQSPIFPILTPIPGSFYYDEMKDKLKLGYEFFDYTHAVTQTKLPLEEFYKAWIQLFLGSYSFSRNIKSVIRRSFAKLIRNNKMKKEYYQKLKKHWKQFSLQAT